MAKNADLYHAGTHYKLALNNGEMPPMTPIPASALTIIDPAFTVGGNGLGSVDSDPERGLRCPVRGCGSFFHKLGIHIAKTHRNIGGVAAVRHALSLPMTAALLSDHARAAARESQRIALLRHPTMHAGLEANRATASRKGGLARRVRRMSMGTRNVRESCLSQTMHKIVDLHLKLGRSPSQREFQSEYSISNSAITAFFGTWSNALAQCGLAAAKTGRKRMPRTAVVDAVDAWYRAHGRLPFSSDLDVAPVLPRFQTVCRAFDVSSWGDAMRICASLLNVYGGPYGLPEKQGAA